MKVNLVFIFLYLYQNAQVQSVGIRIGTSGKIGFTGIGGKIGSSIGSTLSNMPSIRIGSSSGHGFGSKSLHLPAIKLGSGGIHGGIASSLDGLPSIKIGGGSSSVSSLVGGFSGGSPFDSTASSSSGRKMYIPVPVPIAMPSYQRPLMPRPYPQPMSYPPQMYRQESSYRPPSNMEDLYKMVDEYKPQEDDEYKVDNYKELSGYEEDKPEKYSMDDEMTEYKKEKKYKPSKDMEYKIEDDDSKYSTADDGKYEEEDDSKYKSSYKPKDDEYGSMDDSYSSPQPPTRYSADDFYKADDEYKPTKDERKYPSSDDSSSAYDNPYRSLTTSQKNLNSGQQDYMTLVGKQFDIKPRYNSVPPSTLPPHAQQNKAQSNSYNNNNEYPSSIQQQLRQIHSKSPSSYNRSPPRQNNDNDDHTMDRNRKPAAQSYPVPARAQNYPQRQNSGYPPAPVKAMQYASDPVQQEYEPEDQPAYPVKKKKSQPRRPVYDEEDEEYERPSRTRKSRKMRRPERYEDDEEEYPVSKSRRRRPTETYEEEEYEIPKSKSKKKKSSSYAESHEAPLFEAQKSVDDYIRSSGAGGAGLRRNRYEAAGSSSAFSFATAPHEFTKLLLGDEAVAGAATAAASVGEDPMPNLSSSLLLSDMVADRRDSVDEQQHEQQEESPDSRPMPAAQLLPLPPQQAPRPLQAAPVADEGEMERKFDPSIEAAESKVIASITPPVERKEAIDRMMLPKTEVLFSIKKAITEAVGRNQEVYDAIGSARLMNKFEEILSSVEAANYPHPYYAKSNPRHPLAPAPPHITIQQVQ